MSGTPEELLRGALEKIVFFECRVDQLQAEVVATRAAAARAREEAASSRRREAELESALAQARAAESAAAGALGELGERVRLLEAERERFLSTLVERARVSGAPAEADEEQGESADLADFMAELRGEIERLRAWKRAAEAAGVRVEEGVVVAAGAAPVAALAPALGPIAETTETPAAPVATAAAAAPTPIRSEEPRPRAEPVPRLALRFEQAGRIGLPSDARALPHHLATRSERALYESALDDLAASDAGVRRRAAERLRALGARSAAPLLAAAIGREPDAAAKGALLAALGALAEPGAADLAARELDDARPPVRAAALDALHALAGDAAVSRLAGALSDPAPLVRRRAALLLGFCRGPAADEALATALADSDAGVARSVAVALAGRPNPRAQGALARAIASPRAEVRGPASRAVGRWAGVPVQAEVEGPDRRALARKMADRLRELDADALRGAVTAVPAPAAKSRIAAKVRAKAAVPSPPAAKASPRPSDRTPNATPTLTSNSNSTATAAVPSTPDLDRAVLAELRTALRGRTPAELADSIAAPAAAVQGAIRALAAQGVVVARGAKIYAA